jgi:hypothetical protein
MNDPPIRPGTVIDRHPQPYILALVTPALSPYSISKQIFLVDSLSQPTHSSVCDTLLPVQSMRPYYQVPGHVSRGSGLSPTLS